ncbi:MAG TPA: hypothetical protein DD379_26160, partial [Cyanobacteria bacterium UBA11162]|nr:hypothetical protein [Cyanobacteria bacterium UBA11162]
MNLKDWLHFWLREKVDSIAKGRGQRAEGRREKPIKSIVSAINDVLTSMRSAINDTATWYDVESFALEAIALFL